MKRRKSKMDNSPSTLLKNRYISESDQKRNRLQFQKRNPLKNEDQKKVDQKLKSPSICYLESLSNLW